MFDLSVIVCCYNPDITKLKKTLLSINNQKEVSLQIVISDDGSKYKYRNIIEQWCAENKIANVFYNFLSDNVGTVKNITSAVKYCDSKYIKTISPGDYLFEAQTIAKFLGFIRQSNADLIYGDAIYYTDRKIVKQKAIPHSKLIYDAKSIKKIVCLYNGYFHGAAFIARKEIYTDILTSYETKVKYIEDRAIMYSSFIEDKKIVGLPIPMVWYEFGSGISTSNKQDERLINDERMTYEIIKYKYPEVKLAKKMVKKYELKKCSKLLKAIYFAVYFPGFYVYHIKKLFSGYLKHNVSIEMQDEIVKLN